MLGAEPVDGFGGLAFRAPQGGLVAVAVRCGHRQPPAKALPVISMWVETFNVIAELL
jgi:hypothetical protein